MTDFDAFGKRCFQFSALLAVAGALLWLLAWGLTQVLPAALR